MLNITNLYADYGGKPALEDINLTLDSGELLVVLGPSGCGKTTLLNLIAGFVPYQHGTIQLEGKKVEGPGAERGVVFQNEGLLPWRNVQENVAWVLPARWPRIRSCCCWTSRSGRWMPSPASRCKPCCCACGTRRASRCC